MTLSKNVIIDDNIISKYSLYFVEYDIGRK